MFKRIFTVLTLACIIGVLLVAPASADSYVPFTGRATLNGAPVMGATFTISVGWQYVAQFTTGANGYAYGVARVNAGETVMCTLRKSGYPTLAASAVTPWYYPQGVQARGYWSFYSEDYLTLAIPGLRPPRN